MRHFLFGRTDHLGDCVLTLPSVRLVRELYPDYRITFLCSEYVKEMLALVPGIDGVVTYQHLLSLPRNEAVSYIRSLKVDVFLGIIVKAPLLGICREAGIPLRITHTSLFPLFRFWHVRRHYKQFQRCRHFNKFVIYKKKDYVHCHETELKARLLEKAGVPSEYLTKEQLAKRIGLAVPEITPEIQSLLSSEKDVFNLILHPGSQANGREWGEENFLKLIEMLDSGRFRIFITGVEAEKSRFRNLMKVDRRNVTNLMGQVRLHDFLTLIGHSDGLLAASTGPLHIAGAMGINTLGLFPPKAYTDITRWGVLGNKAHSISLLSCLSDENCVNETCQCMSALTPESIEGRIMKWYEDKCDKGSGSMGDSREIPTGHPIAKSIRTG